MHVKIKREISESMNYSGTTQLRRFLNNSKVSKVLKTKPLEQGFSLIELVVVVAVLAVLAAVALPAFLNVNKDAQIAAAKNTLATIVKECIASEARNGSTLSTDTKADDGKLNGFNNIVGNASTCYNASLIATNATIPSFFIAYSAPDGTAVRTCSTTATTYNAGCFTNATISTAVPYGTITLNASW